MKNRNLANSTAPFIWELNQLDFFARTIRLTARVVKRHDCIDKTKWRSTKTDRFWSEKKRCTCRRCWRKIGEGLLYEWKINNITEYGTRRSMDGFGLKSYLWKKEYNDTRYELVHLNDNFRHNIQSRLLSKQWRCKKWGHYRKEISISKILWKGYFNNSSNQTGCRYNDVCMSIRIPQKKLQYRFFFTLGLLSILTNRI